MSAYEKKLIDGKTISKMELAKRVSKRFEETRAYDDDRYLSCLPPSLKARFLNASQAFERDLEKEMRRFGHPAGGDNGEGGGLDRNETLHAIAFERAVRSGKFCEIDPEKVLKDKTWVDFFAKNNK